MIRPAAVAVEGQSASGNQLGQQTILKQGEQASDNAAKWLRCARAFRAAQRSTPQNCFSPRWYVQPWARMALRLAKLLYQLSNAT